LACYFAGTIVVLLLDRPLVAGLLASLAACTKDEGLLFVAAFLVVVAVMRRWHFLPTITAAIPATILLFVFKLILAHNTSSLSAQSTQEVSFISKATNSARYVTIITSTITELWQMGSGLYHPVLLLIILAAVLRFKPNWRRDVIPAGALTITMAIGYFLVYLLASNDLNWQLGTSLNRLTVQI
jgi:hypothetical protein